MASQQSQAQTGLWIEKPAPDTKIQLRHDLPVPSPGSGQVLVKVAYSGLCHSDIANVLGRHHMSHDIHTPGHEGIGHVVAPTNHPLLGKCVGVRWMASACLNCEICDINETSCPKQKNHGRNAEGTLRQYTVADERFAVPVPESLKAEEAAPLLCAGVSLFSAVKGSDAKPGQWIVITGAGGGLGHLGIQIALSRSLKVLAIDTGASKRDFCLSLGATAFIDYKTDDVVAKVKSLTNGFGAHAIVCTAGSPQAYDLAFRIVRPQGTIVCVGLPGLEYRLPVGPMDLVQGGLTIKGTSNGTREDMKTLFEMAERGEVKAKVEVFGLEEVQSVVERVEKGEMVGRAVFRVPG